ncbi:hypothetical protein [Nocardia brasiliensis]|uniref:hypothetical protein n=1 Tax=Nocardia brasiliensis TaxID=37326 RepID=UPI002454FE02|nr:hypothetical protein [Nocardia brasiliensis]
MGAQDVSARKWARRVMAGVLEAQMRAARATEADLIEFHKHAGRLRRAAQRREVVIAAALTRYEEIAAEAETAQAAVLSRLEKRGMNEAQLLEMTGLEAGRLKRLRRLGTAASVPREPLGHRRTGHGDRRRAPDG